MRVLIDISGSKLRELDRVALQRGQTRAALVREAIIEFLTRHEDAHRAAFGIWRGSKTAGSKLQRRFRSEW